MQELNGAPGTEEQKLPVVELLLAHGADVNIPGPFGMAALKFAEIKGLPEIARILKQHDAKWPPLTRCPFVLQT